MLTTNIAIWAVLTTVVVVLAIGRRRIAIRADESLNVPDAHAAAIPAQAEIARKLAIVDRWGKTLTIVSILYLLCIAVAFIYSSIADTGFRLR
jgi:hypothetical protein